MTVTIKTAGSEEISKGVRAVLGTVSGLEAIKWGLGSKNTIWAVTGAVSTQLAKAGAKYVKINDEMDLYRLKVALTGNAEEREKKFGFPVDTLIISNLSVFQRTLFANRLEAQKRADSNYDDWSWLSSRLKAIYEGINELEVNILTICDVTNVHESTEVKLDIQGEFYNRIHEHVDYALYLGIGEEYALLPEEISATVEGNELIIDASKITGYTYISTRPTRNIPWVHDDTETLDEMPDLTNAGSFDTLIESRKNLTLKDVSSTDIESTEPEEETEAEAEVVEAPQEEETPVEVKKDETVPGMTSTTDIKALLAQKRNSMKGNN